MGGAHYGASRREVLKATGAMTVLTGMGTVSARASTTQSATTPGWAQEAKLTAADGDSDDSFGVSVAVSGDGTTAIVGAYADEDPNGEDAGSAYVFSERGGDWTQQTKLSPTDGESNDLFGYSVAVSGDGTSAIVGAHGDEDPNGEDTGSAYVFSESGGDWTQQAKLAATDGDSDDSFGGSVAVSGDGTTAIVGASMDDGPNGEDAGSAYVFSERGGDWTQQAKLTAADGDSYDSFAHSVAVSGGGTTAIVGAYGDDDPKGYDAGSAYVFSESGGQWTQQAKLSPTDGDIVDQFGGSVAVAGDGATAIVGAPWDEDPNGKYAGSAYVFSGSGGDWSQQAKLAATDGDSDDVFGGSVAVAEDGTTALVGASGNEDPNGKYAGSAYVFSERGGEWTQQAKLAAADGESYDSFADSVAVSGDGTTAIVGAPENGDPNGFGAGSAYVFDTQRDDGGILDTYDEDENGTIGSLELHSAFKEWQKGNLSSRKLLKVFTYWQSEESFST